MSVEQIQRALNQIDKELVDLEKKLAEQTKKEADKTKRINDTQKSITRNTSLTTAQSKLKQIQGFQNDLANILQSKSDINKKLADKKKKRAETYLKLQKEQLSEQKAADKIQKQIHDNYEQQISNLYKKLQEKTHLPTDTFQKNSLTEETYDVFISHAWEDKDSFVTDFVTALINLGLSPWYDKDKISWGDSMRARIDDGLRKSKFGVVVISPNYIADGKYWTKTELDGLFQLESVNGKTILPIWHNITKKEVMDYSPIIAGRMAMSTGMMTPDEIALELKNLLSKGDNQ